MSEHIPVLLKESLSALQVQPSGIYVDGTFGRGGHSQSLLSLLGDEGRLIAFDKDPAAIAIGKSLEQNDKRFRLISKDFASLSESLNEIGVHKVNGILLDLGVSSPQLDDASRGFSFRFDAPLDMRMDTREGITAAEWINTASEEEIRRVIKEYGEERFARKIACAIVVARAIKPILTTFELAQIVSDNVYSKPSGKHPATRTFQAIRIHINQELEAVKQVLPQAVSRLTEGGVLAVISFHSLEDRITKQFMSAYSSQPRMPKWVAVSELVLPSPPLKLLGRKIKATEEEVNTNPRARSAVLRVAERTDAAWRVNAE